MPVFIRCAGLVKGYGEGVRRVDVLKGLDLVAGRGEMLAVVGSSGVGKSTLLNLLALLDRPESGSYEFCGKDVLELDDDGADGFRRSRIGFVFQNHRLLPEFTACENVAMPLRIRGEQAVVARGRAESVLEELGMAERSTHRPFELSGGEQQRVAVARALINEPMMLLADEPTGNLDARNSQRLMDLLCAARERRGLTVVIASHNERLVQRCDRVLRLEDGVLREQEAGQDVTVGSASPAVKY
jgi:lipoprotein-releasing system ATP-binding protein